MRDPGAGASIEDQTESGPFLFREGLDERRDGGVEGRISRHGVCREQRRYDTRDALGVEGLEPLDDEGYIDTGDIARIDEDGFVWIEGRVSDLINRGGNKVFPDAVEEVLRLHADVLDVSVVGVPDARLGEVPVAFVVGRVDEDALSAHCREHLVPYKVPVAFVAIDELPRSDVGKVLRRDLASRWSAHRND